jgi:hypothetical protein
VAAAAVATATAAAGVMTVMMAAIAEATMMAEAFEYKGQQDNNIDKQFRRGGW